MRRHADDWLAREGVDWLDVLIVAVLLGAALYFGARALAAYAGMGAP